MERTIVTHVRDLGAFTIGMGTREIIVYIPKDNVSQLKSQFQVKYPEQLKGKEVFVNLKKHRIYPQSNSLDCIGVFCNMEVL